MKAIRLKSERGIVWSAFFDIDVMLKSIGRNREKNERTNEREQERAGVAFIMYI